MNFTRFLIAAVTVTVLLALFLIAVREGRFASPGARLVVVAVIAFLALLAWLLPVR